jgi:hypothetical protein
MAVASPVLSVLAGLGAAARDLVRAREGMCAGI